MTTAAPSTTTTVAPSAVEPGDHDRFAHYVDNAKIVDSAVAGTPLTALCGYTWVPSRDPEKFPVCPECKDIYDNVVGTGPGAQE